MGIAVVLVVFVCAPVLAIWAGTTLRRRSTRRMMARHKSLTEAHGWSGTMSTPMPAPAQRRYPIPRSKPAPPVPPPSNEGCDLCGYSSVSGSHLAMITPARHKVITYTGQSLTFCTHHFRAIAPLVAERKYQTEPV